jgi:hypothetical protein
MRESWSSHPTAAGAETPISGSKKLKSGEESLLTRESTDEYRPVFDGHGVVAFNRTGGSTTTIELLDTATGRVRRLCESCGEVADISRDGRRVLAIKDRVLVTIDVGSGSAQTLLADQDHGPQEAAYSPDGRWISLATYVRGKDPLSGYVLPAEHPSDPRG